MSKTAEFNTEVGIVKKDPFISMEEAMAKENRAGLLVRANADDGTKVEIRDVNRSNLEVEFIISSFRKDDFGTRFDPNGMDLSQFRQNPVVLYRHMRDSGIYTLPIGRARVETAKVDQEGRIHMVARFTPEETFPFGFQVYKLVRDGFLNMASIGAQVLGEETITEEDGTKTIVFRKWKLFEFSVVPIGANDDALVVDREIEASKDSQRVMKDFVGRGEEEEEPKEKPEGEEKIEKDDKGEEESEEKPKEEPRESDDQRKHREYFEESQVVMYLYRKSMAKFYKRMGLVPPKNEEEAVRQMLHMIKPPNPKPASETQRRVSPSVTQKVDEEALRKRFTAELAERVLERKRKAMLQGKSLRWIEDQIPEWTREESKVLSTNPS